MCICNVVVTEHMCCVYSYQILQCSEHPSFKERFDKAEKRRHGHGSVHAHSTVHVPMDVDAIRTLLR